MQKVLVTGGSGVVGSYLRRALAAECELTCLSRSRPVEEWQHYVAADLFDAEAIGAACRGQNAVVHLAGVPGPGRASSADLLHANVVGTAAVLEAAVAAGVRRFVLASSGAATGFSFQQRPLQPRYLPLDEAHPCEPDDEYGLSKLLAELACARYQRRFGITTICLRINHNWCVDRAGAEVAVRSGWAARAALTVEQLWGDRYRKVVKDPHGEGEWPTPGPPSPPQLLWAVTDIRDAAEAVRLALTTDVAGHHALHINGADTCSMVTTRDLIGHHHPDAEMRTQLDGHDSLISCALATDVIGYRPQHSWRHSEFATWLEARA